MAPAAGTRVIGYARVSTDGQDLDGQDDAIRDEAERRGWELLDIVPERASGKSMTKRPELSRCFAVLDAGFADALVVAKLDRLTRSTLDFAGILERSRAKGWKLVVLDADLDTTTPMGEAMANVLMTFAQLERQLIGERTKAGLAAKRRRGVVLGRRPNVPAEILKRIRAERRSGGSFGAIAAGLNLDAVPTAQGGREWYPSTVRAVIARTGGE